MEFQKWIEAVESVNVTLRQLEKKAYDALMALLRHIDSNKTHPYYARFFAKKDKVIYFKRLEKMLRALSSNDQQIEANISSVVGGLLGAGVGGLTGGLPGAIAGGLIGSLGGDLAQKGYNIYQQIRGLGGSHYNLERNALWALAELIDFIKKNYDNLDNNSKYRVWHYWKLLHSTANVLDSSQAETYYKIQQQKFKDIWGWAPEHSWGYQYEYPTWWTPERSWGYEYPTWWTPERSWGTKRSRGYPTGWTTWGYQYGWPYGGHRKKWIK